MRDETELRRHFDIPNCVSFNAALLFEDYARIHFALKPEASLRERYRKEFPSALFSHKYIEAIAPPAEQAPKTEAPDLAPSRQDWSSYEPMAIWLSAQHTTSMDELSRIIRDPITPKQLADLLKELEAALHKMTQAIGESLILAAQQMPDNYPEQESLKNADQGWVSNQWNRSAGELEPFADKIRDYIRFYVQSEKTGFGNEAADYRRRTNIKSKPTGPSADPSTKAPRG